MGVTRRNRTATITVTRRIPTVMITTAINNPMEDTVKSNLMVIKVTVMVMATNNTEDMDVNLTDTVTNLPTDTDTKVMEAMVTNNLMVDMVTSNPMVDMVTSNLMVNTTATTTNLTEQRSDSNFISVIT